MQFLKIHKHTTLSDLTNEIGTRNIMQTLHLNGVQRVPRVGEAFYKHIAERSKEIQSVSPETKCTILNTFTGDSDVFENASLLDDQGWKALATVNTFPDMLRIPDSITLPDSVNILGNNQHISHNVYNSVIKSIKTSPHTVNPSIFNTYSSKGVMSSTISPSVDTVSNPMNWFRIPWGDVTLHSQLTGKDIQFPVYPEDMSDKRQANYSQMPDLLYQYEPWMLYQSSGPRTNTYTFSFHRDMWTGDHKDGEANKLIRACMACCYPEYRGSAVYSDIVEFYVAGKLLISGIVTDVSVNWDGPIGHDGYYLHCTLTLTITEISKQKLTNKTVRNLPLIG